MPLLNLLNQAIVLVDLFIINITPTNSYFRFYFSVYSTLFFKLLQINFFPRLCFWQYHRWCYAGLQPLVYSFYCFLSCNFYVVIKKKKCEQHIIKNIKNVFILKKETEVIKKTIQILEPFLNKKMINLNQQEYIVFGTITILISK